ncbi:MAG: DNA-3-methyladenine glycosylase 2 family protein [Actinobacteria bacterium]|nr:DNA-3-methyladenine glycosylase 2 family protein [Actinomycetota bacterium]
MRLDHVRASEQLAEIDPVMARLVERHGPMRRDRPVPVARRFESLASTIAYQQLAGRAAATIWSRVRALTPEGFTPEAVLALDPRVLRSAGLSGAKTLSLLDLASHVGDGRLRLDRLGRLSDDEVISQLIQVRGIGPWSAQMFLMHELGRLDVWPTGDLGVRIGYARAYRLDATPTPKELGALGDRLRPYRSVAAWYCWRCADDPSELWA